MPTNMEKTPIKPQFHRNMHKSLVEKSPIRKSIPYTSTPVMQHIVNDDEAERARRRSCSELQKRVSNIGSLNRSITASNASDSESCAISEASLEDHYETCVKLFTENKINTKNAWNLHIIEFMRAMLKKGLVMKETLKLASTSLDIGSKVYGLRVDDIHTDIFKLASAMSRINMDLENNKENEEENPENSGKEEEETNEKKKQKEKKKRKRISCDDENAELMIAKDEKSLNGNITPHNTQQTGAASSGKDRLYTLSMLSRQASDWEQLVNCRTNFKFWTPLETVKEAPVNEPVPVTIPNAEGILCPSFMDFVIDQWSPDDDDVPLSTQQARAKGDEIVYDDNGLPIAELDASIPDIQENNFDNDDFGNCGDDIEEEVGARLAGARPPVAFITDMRPGDGPISDKPLQYSYRAAPMMSNRYTITGVWAGPSHWKIKCLQRRTSGQVSVQGVAQKGRRITRAGAQIIASTNIEEEEEQQVVPSKKKLTRTRNHLRYLDKFTLPEDMCIKTDFLCRLSLRPWLKQPIGGTESMQLKAAASADLNISSVYQYDNPNDADYCSQNVTLNDADTAADDMGDDHVANAPNFSLQEFGEDNMVDMPNIVQKTYVPYATQAKKMDMKKLKDAIWKSMASVHSGDDSILENEEELRAAKLDHVSFAEMYNELPKHISSRMGDELSCPLAFVAVLHLANEQTLKLEGQEDLLDFRISTVK